MLIIKLDKKTNIEKALKQLRSKVIRTKQLKELRDRKQYTKPSAMKRLKNQKAVYIQAKKQKEEGQS